MLRWNTLSSRGEVTNYSLPARDDDKWSQSKIDAMQCFTHNVSLCVSVSVRVVCEWVRSWWSAWKGKWKRQAKKASPQIRLEEDSYCLKVIACCLV